MTLNNKSMLQFQILSLDSSGDPGPCLVDTQHGRPYSLSPTLDLSSTLPYFC